MERADLLEANGGIFRPQGRRSTRTRRATSSVLVVGNPANTNALIACQHAPDVPRERFSAMMRLDHNRAKGQLAAKAGVGVAEVTNMTIWGNHSATSTPTSSTPRSSGRNATEVVVRPGLAGERLHPDGSEARRRDHRGARIIQRRLRRQRRDRPRPRLAGGRRAGDWVSMAVPPTVPTECRRGSSAASPSRRRAASYTIVEGSSRRLLALANRCQRRGADRRARRRARARPAR